MILFHWICSLGHYIRLQFFLKVDGVEAIATAISPTKPALFPPAAVCRTTQPNNIEKIIANMSIAMTIHNSIFLKSNFFYHNVLKPFKMDNNYFLLFPTCIFINLHLKS